MISIILVALAIINSYWAWQRTKYAKDSLTLQRLDFEKVWSQTEEDDIDLDRFEELVDDGSMEYKYKKQFSDNVKEAYEAIDFKVGGTD